MITPTTAEFFFATNEHELKQKKEDLTAKNAKLEEHKVVCDNTYNGEQELEFGKEEMEQRRDSFCPRISRINTNLKKEDLTATSAKAHEEIPKLLVTTPTTGMKI